MVEARDSGTVEASAKLAGDFSTPADAENWQDVSFGVVTGQSYWDLDHREGYHIYPAMQAQELDFLVPTGDTVYRARRTGPRSCLWKGGFRWSIRGPGDSESGRLCGT